MMLNATFNNISVLSWQRKEYVDTSINFILRNVPILFVVHASTSNKTYLFIIYYLLFPFVNVVFITLLEFDDAKRVIIRIRKSRY